MILVIVDEVKQEVGDDLLTTYQLRLKDKSSAGLDLITSELKLGISWETVGDVSTRDLFFVAAQAAAVAAAFRTIHLSNRDGVSIVGLEFTVEGLAEIIHD